MPAPSSSRARFSWQPESGMEDLRNDQDDDRSTIRTGSYYDAPKEEQDDLRNRDTVKLAPRVSRASVSGQPKSGMAVTSQATSTRSDHRDIRHTIGGDSGGSVARTVRSVPKTLQSTQSHRITTSQVPPTNASHTPAIRAGITTPEPPYPESNGVSRRSGSGTSQNRVATSPARISHSEIAKEDFPLDGDSGKFSMDFDARQTGIVERPTTGSLLEQMNTVSLEDTDTPRRSGSRSQSAIPTPPRHPNTHERQSNASSLSRAIGEGWGGSDLSQDSQSLPSTRPRDAESRSAGARVAGQQGIATPDNGMMQFSDMMRGISRRELQTSGPGTGRNDGGGGRDAPRMFNHTQTREIQQVMRDAWTYGCLMYGIDQLPIDDVLGHAQAVGELVDFGSVEPNVIVIKVKVTRPWLPGYVCQAQDAMTVGLNWYYLPLFVMGGYFFILLKDGSPSSDGCEHRTAARIRREFGVRPPDR